MRAGLSPLTVQHPSPTKTAIYQNAAPPCTAPVCTGLTVRSLPDTGHRTRTTPIRPVCYAAPMTAEPTATCEPDEDYAVCDICGRTVFDTWTAEEHTGCTVCEDCEQAERDYYMRRNPRPMNAALMPPPDQRGGLLLAEARRDEQDALDAMSPGTGC